MIKVNIDNNLEKVESQVEGPNYKIFSEIAILILIAMKEDPKLLEDIKHVIETIDYANESDIEPDKVIEFFINAYFKTIKNMKELL